LSLNEDIFCKHSLARLPLSFVEGFGKVGPALRPSIHFASQNTQDERRTRLLLNEVEGFSEVRMTGSIKFRTMQSLLIDHCGT